MSDMKSSAMKKSYLRRFVRHISDWWIDIAVLLIEHPRGFGASFDRFLNEDRRQIANSRLGIEP